LQVGSSIYIGLSESYFLFILSTLATVAMYLSPGHGLGALAMTREDKRVSWACFAGGVSSSPKGVPSSLASTGRFAWCPTFFPDSFSQFDTEDDSTVQRLGHFELVTSLFSSAFSTPKSRTVVESCRLGVPSTLV
jgi:hypothetical protein